METNREAWRRMQKAWAEKWGEHPIKKPRHEPCPKCGSKLIRAPYVIVCESVLCDFDARRPQ